VLILRAKRGGVESPTRTPFFTQKAQLTNQLTKKYKAMKAKKPIKENKTRIKAVLATMKESTILLQGSKSKVVIKVSVVAASVIAALNLLIELL
jgi:hypothetical protein